MSTLVPRPPYSKDELEKLYPPGLELMLSQIFLRHGERSPISARFQNAGLTGYWPYCSFARRMASIASSDADASALSLFEWRRQFEGFGKSDQAVVSHAPEGETQAICQAGELTDDGRRSTYALGQRLRHLYVEQLGFLPPYRSNTDDLYLRSTPIPRALQSLQQTFWGLYPAVTRSDDFKMPTIVERTPSEETLFPNEAGCRRLRQLSRLFSDIAVKRWNDSEEMNYISSMIGKYMPEGNAVVAVNSHPRLSGINDTINATHAHGPETRLPHEFYDEKVRNYIDDIVRDEWFRGYEEDVEVRKLGIGAQLGDVTDRMVEATLRGGWKPDVNGKNDKETSVKMALSGCHDTTLTTMLLSLGILGERWPPFTASLVFELFKNKEGASAQGNQRDILTRFFSSANNIPEVTRGPHADLSHIPELDDHYVRVRYNDRVLRLPGCAEEGRHLPGDNSFCTLRAFKEIIDKITPRSYKEECQQNMDKGIYAEGKSKAGY